MLVSLVFSPTMLILGLETSTLTTLAWTTVIPTLVSACLGSRVNGKTEGGMLYDFEGGVQFGTNSNGTDHSAGFVTAGLGRQLNIGGWKPTIWGFYDYASGADANDQPFSQGDDGFLSCSHWVTST